MSYHVLDYANKKPLGKTNEKVATLGLGTLSIRDFVSAERALLKAIELGLNVIEVSDSYAFGLSMDLIKKILANIERSEIFITFRVSPIVLSDPRTAIMKFEQILRKMGTNFVDVLMPAGYTDFVSLDTVVKALEAIADKGLARYLGLSEFKVRQINEVLHMLHKYDVVMVQSRYSVFEKRIEKDLIPFAVKTGITIQACTTLEKGRVLKHPVVLQVASKHGRTAAQVALNYVIARPRVIALTKTERIEHVVEDREAIDLRLDEEDLNKLSMV
jgi:diketogulonate reductase-like aldo/keto reductase